MEQKIRREYMLQELPMTTDEQRESMSFHCCGSGLVPAKSNPEGLSHMMMEQEADREGRLVLFSVLNIGKLYLSMLDVPFCMQVAIGYS